MFYFLITLLLFTSVHCQDIKFLGVTSEKYAGDMTSWFHDNNGYDDGRMACEKEYPNSRMCTVHDIAVTAQWAGLNQGGTYR